MDSLHIHICLTLILRLAPSHAKGTAKLSVIIQPQHR